MPSENEAPQPHSIVAVALLDSKRRGLVAH